MSFNINFSRTPLKDSGTGENKYAFLKQKNKIVAQIALLKSMDPDFCGLQEVVSHPEDVDSLEELRKYFPPETYHFILANFKSKRLHEVGGQQYVASMYKKAVYDVTKSEGIELGQFSGTKVLGVVLCDQVLDKQTKKRFIFVNCHYYPARTKRFASGQVMGEVLTKFGAKESDTIFIFGDGNRFPDDGGDDQTQDIICSCKKEGFLVEDITIGATYQNGEHAKHSFDPYEYDRLRMPKSAFDGNGELNPGLIDMFFMNRKKGLKVETPVVYNGTSSDILKMYYQKYGAEVESKESDKTESKELKDPLLTYRMDKRLLAVKPSDHMPVVVDFSVES